MPKDSMHSGYVEMTPRGFRQDADNAMKGDIVRGLIEALTNADDNYGDSNGRTRVFVSRKRPDRSYSVSIADRGTGLTAEQMRKHLLKAGGRSSGHERGEDKRGNRGRGAKDLSAFGLVQFDSRVADERSTLEIRRGGAYSGPRRPVDAAEWDDLSGLRRHSGTVVTITCQSGVERPQFDTLRKRITNAVALRRMLQDPKRTVLLCCEGRDEVTLRYLPPKVARLVRKAAIDVPGYGTANLEIFESAEQLPESRDALSRLDGLVVTSGRACHEATLFGAEGNPYANRLFGWLEFPAIDRLAREYDDRDDAGEVQSAENPMPIIRRDRDNLEHHHPAYKALKRAVDPILNEYLKELAEKNRGGGSRSNEAARRNANMARALARWTVEQRERLEVDDHPIPEDLTFSIVPTSKSVEFGCEQSFSVRCPAALVGNGDSVYVALSVAAEEGILRDYPQGRLALRQETKDDITVYRGTFKVTAGVVEGQVLVEAQLVVDGAPSAVSALATIDIVEPLPSVVPDPPVMLQFERERYTVSPGKRRHLLVLAPREVVSSYGMELRISSDSEAVPLMSGSGRVQLEEVAEGWFEAVVDLEGRQLGAEATITARFESALERAQATVSVREPQGAQFKIELKALKGNARAVWLESREGVAVEVNATHPGVARYFGAEEDGFPHQDSLLARVAIAEAVADEAVRAVLRKSAERTGEEMDFEAFTARRRRMLADLLPRLHREQISDAEVTEYNRSFRVAGTAEHRSLDGGTV